MAATQDRWKVAPDLPIYSLVPIKGERWLNFYRQQTRAFNLVDHLCSQPAPPRKVLVVGGGLAGLTFAAGYALRAHESPSGSRTEVTVVEQFHRPLWNLRGCRTRWVHPLFFTWPLPGWDVAETSWPIMNWSSGPADEVCTQLESELHRLMDRLRQDVSIRILTDTQLVQRATAGSGLAFSCHRNANHGRTPEDINCDAVVLAMGPGHESTMTGTSWQSYWHDDCHDRIDPRRPPPVRYAVIGSGDGALTDYLRVRLQSFVHHDEIAKLGARFATNAALRRRLLELEHEIKHGPATPDKLDNDLKSIAQEYLREDSNALSGFRGETSAKLFTSSSHPLVAPGTATIHRLLAAMVRERDGENFGLVVGRAQEAKLASSPSARSEYTVNTGGEATEALAQERFDHVIVRAGVDWTSNTLASTFSDRISARIVLPSHSESSRLSEDPRSVVVRFCTPLQGNLRVSAGVDRPDSDLIVQSTETGSPLTCSTLLVIKPNQISITSQPTTGGSPVVDVGRWGPSSFPLLLLSQDTRDDRAVIVLDTLPPPPSDHWSDPVAHRLGTLLGATLRVIVCRAVHAAHEGLAAVVWEEAIEKAVKAWRSWLELHQRPALFDLFVADPQPGLRRVFGSGSDGGPTLWSVSDTTE